MVDIKDVLFAANLPYELNMTTLQRINYERERTKILDSFLGQKVTICGFLRDVTNFDILLTNSLPLGHLNTRNGKAWIVSGSMLFEIRTKGLSTGMVNELRPPGFFEVTGEILKIGIGSHSGYQDASFVLSLAPSEFKATKTNCFDDLQSHFERYYSDEEKKAIKEQQYKEAAHLRDQESLGVKTIVFGVAILIVTFIFTSNWRNYFSYICLGIGIMILIGGISIFRNPSPYEESD